MPVNEAERKSILDLVKRANEIAQGAKEGLLDGEQKANMEKILDEAKSIRARANERDSIAKSISEVTEGLESGDLKGVELVPEARAAQESGASVSGPVGKTLGNMWVQSKAYKDLIGSFGGRAPSEKQRVSSDTMLLPPGAAKALITSGGGSIVQLGTGTSGGVFTRPDFYANEAALGSYQRPLRVAGLFSHLTTETDTIYYPFLGTQTNNAAAVREATTSAGAQLPSGAYTPGSTLVYPSDGSAGNKPESALSWTVRSTNVKTVANTMPLSKRSLADAPQVQGIVEQFLDYGLDFTVEQQLLTGDGTGENLTGLNNVAGIQTATVSTVSGSRAQGYFKTLLSARNLVRVNAHANPGAYLFNPTDLADVLTLANAQGAYYGAAPFAATVPLIWGQPVVESESVAVNTAYVADWSRGIIWDRQDSTMAMSDSHADFFIRNLVMILVELRLAFALVQPNAFVKIPVGTNVT